MFEFQWIYLAVAFAAGVAGAAFGALPIFILCGLVAITAATVSMIMGHPAEAGTSAFMQWVVWGPLLGPQTSFAGGIAAAAYAGKLGLIKSGRDILSGLMGLDRSDVLVVGGVFGALCYLMQVVLQLVPNIGELPWTNTIAMAIVLNGMLARLVFGKKGILGKVRPGDSRWVPSDVAGWLPWQSRPGQLLLIGFGMGLPVAFVMTLYPSSAFLWFGLGVFSLIYLQYGTRIPVTHHIALSAEFAVLQGGDVWWGLAFGVLAVYLSEFFACLFTAHADSHIDPPTCALVTVFTLVPVAKLMGWLTLAPPVSPAVATGVAVIGFLFFTLIQRAEPVAVKVAPEPALEAVEVE